ncbi:hypothetical protein [Ornithobacterium rhinotracheale]
MTVDNADGIKTTFIAEGSNGPTDSDAEEILLKKVITIITDILCKGGGVNGSYF